MRTLLYFFLGVCYNKLNMQIQGRDVWWLQKDRHLIWVATRSDR